MTTLYMEVRSSNGSIPIFEHLDAYFKIGEWSGQNGAMLNPKIVSVFGLEDPQGLKAMAELIELSFDDDRQAFAFRLAFDTVDRSAVSQRLDAENDVASRPSLVRRIAGLVGI
ncbi:hypothetical protein SR39_31465 [Methylobacterium radiotolerans]|nr:hypothetical protein SR39_31465 [Methylobacterium radiotolerans]